VPEHAVSTQEISSTGQIGVIQEGIQRALCDTPAEQSPSGSNEKRTDPRDESKEQECHCEHQDD
jgi:hypothetical protein